MGRKRTELTPIEGMPLGTSMKDGLLATEVHFFASLTN